MIFDKKSHQKRVKRFKQWWRNRQLRKEANYYWRTIVETGARLGFEAFLRKEMRPDNILEAIVTGARTRRTLRCIECRGNEAAFYFWIDMQDLPDGTSLEKLKNPDIWQTISFALGHQTYLRAKGHDKGVWIVLERDGAVSGIPTTFRFQTAYEALSAKARPLEVIIGCAENYKLIQRDIADMPHLFICGATGYGKSVELNSITLQILMRNPPEKVQFYMIDLKGGMELLPYKDLPHVKRFVKDPEEVPQMLEELEIEILRRSEMFGDAGHTDLRGWNRFHRDSKLPQLVLIVDELAQVLKHPDSKLAQLTSLRLGRVLQIGRAAGCSALLCTQRPGADVIEGWLKTNVSVRMAFRLPTPNDSRVVINVGDAAHLEHKGRAFFTEGADLIEIQAPLVTPNMRGPLVKQIRAKWEQPIVEEDEVTLEDILWHGHYNMQDSLAWKPLYEAFKHRKVTQSDIREMLEYAEDKTFCVDGLWFQVANFGEGRKGGRRMVLIDDPVEQQLEAAPALAAEPGANGHTTLVPVIE